MDVNLFVAFFRYESIVEGAATPRKSTHVCLRVLSSTESRNAISSMRIRHICFSKHSERSHRQHEAPSGHGALKGANQVAIHINIYSAKTFNQSRPVSLCNDSAFFALKV